MKVEENTVDPSPDLLPAKNALVLKQYELHNLVLVHHVDCDVSCLHLRPQQCGSKYDGHALSGHTICFPMFDHPVEMERNESHFN